MWIWRDTTRPLANEVYFNRWREEGKKSKARHREVWAAAQVGQVLYWMLRDLSLKKWYFHGSCLRESSSNPTNETRSAHRLMELKSAADVQQALNQRYPQKVVQAEMCCIYSTDIDSISFSCQPSLSSEGSPMHEVWCQFGGCHHRKEPASTGEKRAMLRNGDERAGGTDKASGPSCTWSWRSWNVQFHELKYNFSWFCFLAFCWFT